MRRVVITGIGVVSPLGIGQKAFWTALVEGVVGIGRIRAFDPGGFPCQVAGEVPEYRIAEHVPKSYRKATKVMARDIELAVIAADDALRDSGLKTRGYSETPDIDPRRFGCNIGAGLISAELNELGAAMNTARDGNRLDLRAWGSTGMNNLTPLWLLKYLPNMLACHVTIIHELKGPSNTITCADASSHLAIGEAFRTIQRGAADLAICGGAESRLNPMGLLRQCLLGRMNTTSNDSPQTAVRPFSPDGAGTVIGEGGGLFVLEEMEHAKRRGARIYAEVAGFGASQDTAGLVAPAPNGYPTATAITRALADANAGPDEVDLIVPHGLGLASHDRAELQGLERAFDTALLTIPLAPIKAQVGNLAAGCGVDAAAAVLALHHGLVPPAAYAGPFIDELKLNVSKRPRPAGMDLVVSSVHSLGGQNAALVFRKAAS